ncbi:hypothetical protein ACFL96_13020 [Thermoproteota archaeon]
MMKWTRVFMIFVLLLLLLSVSVPLVMGKKDKNPPTKGPGTTTTAPDSTPAPEPQIIYVNQTVPVHVQDNGVNWEMIGVIIIILGGIVGWIITRFMRGKTAKYMSEIDKAYRQYNKNVNKCEAELTHLREKVENDFKRGKLNDQGLAILEKRIDKYSKDLRSDIIRKRFDLPPGLDKSIKGMLSDGVITKQEYNNFKKMMNKSKLDSKEKEELRRLMNRWKIEDKK